MAGLEAPAINRSFTISTDALAYTLLERSLEWAFLDAPDATGDQPLTVTDMERFEHAARLSMGGIPDADMPAAASPDVHPIRFIGLALIAAAALAVVLRLL